MRKIVFIFLIILVAGIVGFYCWVEFSIPEITYVNDTVSVNTKGNECAVRRLYSSGTNYDELQSELDSSLISTEFTEDEVYAAALKSGTPEFFPAFYTSVYREADGEYTVRCWVQQEVADGQTNADFVMSNLRVEAVGTGVKLDECVTDKVDKEIKSYSAPVISEDGTNMTLDMTNIADYTIKAGGTTGNILLQYTYDISTRSIFLPKVVLENQLLMLYVKINVSADGIFSVDFVTEPYSSTEDLE